MRSQRRVSWLIGASVVAMVAVVAMMALIGCTPLAPTIIPVRSLEIAPTAQAKKPIPAEIGQMMGTMPESGLWTTWYSWGPARGMGNSASLALEEPRGVYHFDKILSMLDEAERRGVSVQLQLIAYTSDISGTRYFLTWTPSGYPDDIILHSSGYTAAMPPWANSDWTSGYLACAEKMMEAIDGHPALVSVNVSTGLDGETQPIKDAGLDWYNQMRAEPGGHEYRFGQFVYKAMDSYAAACVQTQAFLNNAPGGNARIERADYAVARGIGLKHSGMWVDLNSHQGYGSLIGSWDAMAKYAGVAPLWCESPFGLGDNELRWWSLLAGLHYLPAAIDVHPEYWSLPAEDLAWATGHIGVTAATSQSAWAVMRDMEYPRVGSETAAVSGKVGNWQQFMTVAGGDRICGRDFARSDAGAAVCTRVLPYISEELNDDRRSRQCRLGDRFVVDVDAATDYQKVAILLTFLDYGQGPITVNCGTDIFQISRQNTGGWVTKAVLPTNWSANGASDIVISTLPSAPLYLHMVEVLDDPGHSPTATTGPSLTASPSTTWVPLVTNTPTQKPTPSATQTPWIVTETPALTPRPTPSGTPMPPWEYRLQGIIKEAGDQGIVLRITAEYVWDDTSK